MLLETNKPSYKPPSMSFYINFNHILIDEFIFLVKTFEVTEKVHFAFKVHSPPQK